MCKGLLAQLQNAVLIEGFKLGQLFEFPSKPGQFIAQGQGTEPKKTFSRTSLSLGTAFV